MWDVCCSVFVGTYNTLIVVSGFLINVVYYIGKVFSWCNGDDDIENHIIRPGDRVHVYSSSLNKWFSDGVVDKVCTITNAPTIHPPVEVGSVHVKYDHLNAYKWIRPVHRSKFLRIENLSAPAATKPWSGIGSIFGSNTKRATTESNNEKLLDQLAGMTTPGFKLMRNEARLKQQFKQQNQLITQQHVPNAMNTFTTAMDPGVIRTVLVTEKPFGFTCTQAKVVNVYPNSLAQRAGIRVGDTICSVNGTFVNGKTFSSVFSSAKPPFRVEVQRNASGAKQMMVPRHSPALSDTTLSSLLNDANQAQIHNTPAANRGAAWPVSTPRINAIPGMVQQPGGGIPASNGQVPGHGGIIQNIGNLLGGAGSMRPSSGQVVQIMGLPSGILEPPYRQIFFDSLKVDSAYATNAITVESGNVQVTYNQHITDAQRQQVEAYFKHNLGVEYNASIRFLGQVQSSIASSNPGLESSFGGGVAVGTNLSLTQFDNTKQVKVISYDPMQQQPYCVRYIGTGEADEWISIDASTGTFTDKFACKGTFAIMAGNENVSGQDVQAAILTEYKNRMQRIYQSAAPHLLASVIKMLESPKWMRPAPNNAHGLYLKVCNKYNITPEMEFTGYNVLNTSAGSHHALNSSHHNLNTSAMSNNSFQCYQDSGLSNAIAGSPFPNSQLGRGTGPIPVPTPQRNVIGAKKFFNRRGPVSPLLQSCRKLSACKSRIPLAAHGLNKPWQRKIGGSFAPRKQPSGGMFTLNENNAVHMGNCLPSGWTKKWSETQKEYYYWNQQTGVTKWEVPTQ